MRHRGEGHHARGGAAVGPTTTHLSRDLGGVGPDLLGVVFTMAAAALVLVRALRPGTSLGPFDLLTRFGLTSHAGVAVHNAVQADQIQQFVPWTDLAWHQVHSGQLPLWNPDNVLGMPLAFNWQSGVFSVPALVGYLFPVAHAYAAAVLTKLVIAGTGGYVLCRVLGLGPLGATFGGTVFELSGPMIVHAGWPHTSVTCWAGWLFAAVVMVLQGRHRLAATIMLALAIGFAVYGGHPESLVVMGVATLVFVCVYLLARARSGGGAVLRPIGDLAIGSVCGFGLGAPLLLPGVQLGVESARRYGTGRPAFPLSHVPNLLAVGLQGNDFETAAYMGVICLALAVVGTKVRWARPEVPAFAAVAVVTVLLTFFSPLDRVLHVVPGGRTVAWSRAVMMLALALAVLGAIGLDALTRSRRDPAAQRWTAGAFAALGVVVIGMAAAAQLGLAPAIATHKVSLVWPASQVAVGLALVVVWRRHAPASSATRAVTQWAPALLLVVETAFLLSAGIPSWSVSSTYFATNPAIATLQRTVGPSLVGYGSCRSLRYLTASKAEVGIRPNANIGYEVHEAVVYDPIIPESYYRSWRAVSGARTPPSLSQLGVFCPEISTVDEARIYGIQYLLEPPGRFGPPGSIGIVAIGGESLYRVPGASEATATPVPARGTVLPVDAPGTSVGVSHPDPAAWRLVLDRPTASILRLRLTDVPGWRATVDGRPLPLRPWASGAMLEAQVGPGHHVVELHYWPVAFSAGLIVGVVVAAGLVVVSASRLVTGRRGQDRPRAP